MTSTDSINLTLVLPTDPDDIYLSWLDSESHSLFTDSKAEIDPVVGGKFTAHDGYISGSFLELRPVEQISMSWRTIEFPEDAPDSRLEIHLEPVDGGTRLFLSHSHIPNGQGPKYEQGWKDHYFEPMSVFFGDE